MATAEIKTPLKPNAKQQECIDNITGKHLVLAGPGTGKTFTVIQRIKAMLERGIDPNKILCLTFSEAAASEMYKKLEEAFGTSDININIYTYHGFCNEIITDNAEAFELPDNYKVIGETIKQEFLKECIDEFKPVYLRNKKNDPYSAFMQTLSKFEEIKKRRLTREKFFYNLNTNPEYYPLIKSKKQEIEILEEHPQDNAKKIEDKLKDIAEIELEINKFKEVWALYELYCAKMEKEHYIDFDDMIILVLDKFEKSPAFLEKIANQYEYIMVDEYQDTNNLQNQIVFNLVEKLKTQNIFVVGDDEQIIYSFQGADIKTIENFVNKFPDTNIICLNENMRSTQSILDVARIVANQDDNRFDIDKNLIAMNKDVIAKDKKVRLTKYNDKMQEFTCIANEIEDLIKSDACPKDKDGNNNYAEIALIATNNEELKEFSTYLKNRNIPYELKDGKSIFEIKAATTLYYYLQMLANPELYSDKILKLLLMPPYNIYPCDFSKIYEKMSKDKTFIDSMREITNWVNPDKINAFLNTYDELKKFSAAESVKNTVLEVATKTGILPYYLNEQINKTENIAGLKKIIDEAANFSEVHKDITLEAFVDYLVLVQNNDDLDIKADKPPYTQNAVQLTTYHSSKGKEYEYVYMPTMQKSRWDSSRKSYKPKVPVSDTEYKDKKYWQEYKKSDRVKNMYVGMTRAKHTLRLSYYAEGGDPSNWIMQAENLLDKVIEPTYDDDIHSNVIEQVIRKDEYDYKRDFNERINSIVQNKYYSPTEINTYLSCPKKYLYENILCLDARIPATDSLNVLNYGNAVHNTFNDIISMAIRDKEYPSKEIFLAKFNEHLASLPLSSKEQREILKSRGEKELSEYYHHLLDTPVNNMYATEYTLKMEIDGVKFKGRLDRIEKNNDGTYAIYDYKTGKSKTAKEINPEGDNWDYYNQICLYKYYFEKEKNVTVNKVGFIFPIDSCVYGFCPTEDECKAVVDKFKASINGIKNCEFNTTQNEKSCKYCQYYDFCTMNAV